MANVILTSEYTANTEYDYKVEILSSGAATANTFKVEDVTISYHPETDNILSPIIPSTAEIVCWNEGGYFNSTFIPDLVLNQQEKYQVKIYQDTGSGYNLWWFGWVLQDQVEEVEASQPRKFVIKCADGLGRLQDNNFIDTNDATTVPERTTLLKLAIKALGYTGLTDLFATNDEYLVSSFDWWENSQTYGATLDPLVSTYLDINIFRIKGEDGSETKYSSAYDVLRQLATLGTCRIYQSEGLWRFEQVGQRTTTSLKENIYRKAGTQLSAGSASYEKSVSRSSSLLDARVANNNETFLPAAKYVKLNYEQAFLTNKIGQYVFKSGSATTITIGTIEGLSETGISIPISYFAGCTISTVALRTKKTKAKFKATITLEAQGGTTYYYTNNNNGEWNTSAVYYYFDSKQERPINADFISVGNYTILTKELPANGELNILIELDDFYYYRVTTSSQGWVATTTSAEDWTVYGVVELEGDGQDIEGAIYSSVNNSTAIGDANTIDLGTINIGDSLFSTGRLMIYNGSTYEKTDSWREGNSGSYTSILQLLCNEALAYFDEPIEVYDGDIYHSKSFQYRLNWDGVYYLPMEVSFSTQQGIWSGRWFAISRDKTNIASETKYERRKRLFRRITANANPSELPDGAIGGVEFEEDSGQFEGLVEFELTAAMIAAGQTGTTVLDAQGSGTYIDVTHVVITTTSGSTPYATAGAQIYFSSETTTVVDSTNLLDSINNGTARRLTGNDAKLWDNEALLFDINADATGDYDFLIKVYYKLIS